MQLLDTIVLRNTVQAWLIALGVAVLTLLVLRFLTLVVFRRLARLAANTEAQWDDVITGAVQQTKSLLLLIVAVYAGSTMLALSDRVVGFLEGLTIIALLVQAGLWAGAGIKNWVAIQHGQRSQDDPAAAMPMNVISIGARIVVWSMVLLLALENMGVDVTALVAGLGIGGIAIALAAQNILGDLFASLTIVLDKPFVPGDFLNVADLMGTVEEIGLKTTRVRAISGEQLIFSNADLLGSRIRNFGRMWERRAIFKIGVTYQTPRKQLQEIPGILRAAIEEHGERVRFDRAHLQSFGDFAIVFETVFFVLKPEYVEYMEIQQAVNLRIHQRFEEEGIEFAYPTQTLFLVKDEA